MTREEKIKFIITAVEDIEGTSLTPDYFKDYSDEKIDTEVDWWEYLSDK